MTGEIEPAAAGRHDGYDGFISYSHAADDLLAPRLQAGLQRFAKPWWKRRAIRIFRDESSLSANPHLWSSITEALDTSGWFVLLLSPDAARSEWVNQEIDYWIEQKDPHKILPVLTDGTLGWTGTDVTGDAVPSALEGVFTEEPRWVDLRWARDEDHLDLNDPRFADAVADIASTIRGIPKDDLASEEVKQHRRTVRTAWAAGLVTAGLALAAAGFGIQSARNAALAVARELAAASVATLETDPELATLLGLAALDASPTGDDPPIELVNAIWQAGSSNRLLDVIETGYDGDLSLSPDGDQLVTTVAPNALRMYDATTNEQLWEYSEETADTFVFPVISPDGRTALPVFDSEAEWAGAVEEPDDLPNRVVILTPDGKAETVLPFPECRTAGNLDWSHTGAYLAVSFLDSCIRDGSPQWVEVFETTEWASVAFRAFDGIPLGPNPRFDQNDRLYLLRTAEQTLVLDSPTFEQVAALDSTGIGDVAVDGSRVFGFYTLEGQTGEAGRQWSVLSFRTDDGQLNDMLYNGIRYPDVPFGVTATEDGRVIVAAGGETHIYDVQGGYEVLRISTGPVSTVGYDPGRQLLYTSGSEDGPRVWDLAASSIGVEPTLDLGDYSWVNGNTFEIGPDLGALMGIDLRNGRARSVFFDLETGNLVDVLPDSFPMRALANGKFYVVLSSEEIYAVAIYDPSTGGLDVMFECIEIDPDIGCLEASQNIAVSVEGTEMFAYPYDEADPDRLTGEVLTIDIDTGEVVGSEFEDPLVIEWFTDSWVLGSPTNRIDYRVVDRASGEVLWQDDRNHIRVMVAPDGSWLATYVGDETVQLVNTETWDTTVIEGFLNIRGGSFNADASLLAVAEVASLRVIDVETGLVAQQVRLPGVSDVYWINDETLIVGTNDGLFGILSISTDELIDRTRAGLRRSFSEQECLIYRLDPCPTVADLRGES